MVDIKWGRRRGESALVDLGPGVKREPDPVHPFGEWTGSEMRCYFGSAAR